MAASAKPVAGPDVTSEGGGEHKTATLNLHMKTGWKAYTVPFSLGNSGWF